MEVISYLMLILDSFHGCVTPQLPKTSRKTSHVEWVLGQNSFLDFANSIIFLVDLNEIVRPQDLHNRFEKCDR